MKIDNRKYTVPQNILHFFEDCTLCPRECHADRLHGRTGYCRQTAVLKAGRAALHFWEEPCISGEDGSGAVFFSGCTLGCVYCQNQELSQGNAGVSLDSMHPTASPLPQTDCDDDAASISRSVCRLVDIFLELQEQGANNINLVTPTHFVPLIAEAVRLSKQSGMLLPVVYNTSSYEKKDTLKLLDGLVDIYLPDMKYIDSELAHKYSKAPNYPNAAKESLAEMVRQAGPAVFNEAGLMKRGVIVRHLVLPGHTADSKRVLRYLHETYGSSIYISIMNQYTPVTDLSAYPEINRPVTEAEYNKVVNFALMLGIENGFTQEGGTVSESFVPAFEGEGTMGPELYIPHAHPAAPSSSSSISEA